MPPRRRTVQPVHRSRRVGRPRRYGVRAGGGALSSILPAAPVAAPRERTSGLWEEGPTSSTRCTRMRSRRGRSTAATSRRSNSPGRIRSHAPPDLPSAGHLEGPSCRPRHAGRTVGDLAGLERDRPRLIALQRDRRGLVQPLPIEVEVVGRRLVLDLILYVPALITLPGPCCSFDLDREGPTSPTRPVVFVVPA